MMAVAVNANGNDDVEQATALAGRLSARLADKVEFRKMEAEQGKDAFTLESRDGKVIIGTRARKLRTRSFNAFSSIDYPELAVIREGQIIPYIETAKPDSPIFYSSLNPRVFVLRLIPGQEPDIFDYLAQYYDALVVEGFGMGGIPFYENGELLAALKRFTESGHILVMTTQVPHEGSDLSVYRVGIQVKNEMQMIEAHTMTIEAIVTKLMWALGQSIDADKVKSLFCLPVAKDLL